MDKKENVTLVREYDSTIEEAFNKPKPNEEWYTKLGFEVEYLYVTLKDKIYDIKRYFRNLKTFHNIIKTWEPFDYQYQVNLFSFGIEQIYTFIEKYGNEETESKNKKVAAMKQLVEVLNKDYRDEAEKEFLHNENVLDTIYHFKEYSDGSISMEDRNPDEHKKHISEHNFNKLKEKRDEHYNTIFRLIKGQDNDKLHEEVEKEASNIEFDGTGIETWWD